MRLRVIISIAIFTCLAHTLSVAVYTTAATKKVALSKGKNSSVPNQGISLNSQTVFRDSFCTDGIDNECAATFDRTDPSCGTSEQSVTCGTFYHSKCRILRSVSTPFVAGQTIDIEILEMTFYGSNSYWGDIVFSAIPMYAPEGQILVDSVDSNGSLIGGYVTFDIFFNVRIIDFPTIPVPHTESTVRLEGSITSWPPSAGTVFETPASAEAVPIHFEWSNIGYVCGFSYTVAECDNACCIGHRGDFNGDGEDANILDLTSIVDFIFRDGPPAGCPAEADLNSDGDSSNILDLTFLVDFIFRGGTAPGACS